MKKIVIIGSPGSGKTTLARLLKQKTQLPTYHLDSLFWRDNWKKTSRDSWIKIQNNLVQLPEWIIDGNYTATLEIRITAADTIIFLDYPTYLCTYRVIKRMFKNHNKKRADLANNIERINLDIIFFTLLFKKRNRIPILNLLNQQYDKHIFILKNKNDLKNFIIHLNKQSIKQ